ncbi:MULTISPECIES: PEP-CTERM sorting domain-containing protein [unclassified Lentimonas]|uniref:PEP-CTERM sorting domain-containing protein n=1 Tax=unclassified Lentimonas TaxID=2630993 RepID=UPI00132A7DA2|nr:MULTISPECIES: PEP-CTERM sorting domain-containing protein [unclassified Lentimonas]CAA6676305.1 Unannotated [Lentimonas sp. CC4]CAA6683805.1 Unannotated [Lentimonas sp. CC6]CAA7077798.1 Unannotated [Lentimonas sp. CC4]CAA7169730.1 Unannotated [Lentimonas sp. CC21]CAA7179552.1 Unannotated [Lentimonas sp. CC8]
MEKHTITQFSLLVAAGLFASSAQADTFTWNNPGDTTASWSVADNWLNGGVTATTAPTDGDSVILNAGEKDGGGGAWVTADTSFTITSGQSVIANEDGTSLRPNGQTFTVATGGTLDLTNGGNTTGTYGNVFGGNNPTLIIESGATARVTTFDWNRASENEIITFAANSLGEVTLFQVDGEAQLGGGAGDALNLDLTDLTAGSELGTYELIDYGSLNGTFGIVNVLGLEAGQTFSTDYVYDFGGGDLGIAISVIPEPGTYALLAGLTGLTFVMLRRRRA